MSVSGISPLHEEHLPVVAIVGRPNVGKSTLFNRLIRKRRAITDAVPGVTRDPVTEPWMLADHKVLLVDSGGVKLDLEGLDSLVREKSLSLLTQADAVILLMDCTEITPEDEMLVEAVRPYSDRVVLAVNKVDDPVRDPLVWNFHAFGFSRVVSISSAHGLGIEDLEDALIELLDLSEPTSVQEEEKSIRLAVLGKPNTGKSTLVNLLTGKETSIVSDIPGTTRDVISGAFKYKGAKYSILDTAGIRRKSKVDEDIEYYSVNRAIGAIDDADVVLLMIDADIGLVDQDKKIAQLIVRKGKGVVLVVNKIDMLNRIANQIEALKDRVRFLFPILSFAPLVTISAKESTGIPGLLDTVWTVYKQLNKRIETAQFNTMLRTWSESYQPARSSSGHYKVFYGTQVSAAPVRFLLFVNKKSGFPTGYEQYLKNAIRRDLGFPYIPIEIELKERRRNTKENRL